MNDRPTFETVTEWATVAHRDVVGSQAVYGYQESGLIHLEGVRFRPQRGRASTTLLVYMHPTASLTHSPVPRAMAAHGLDVLCANSRFAGNDSALVMEKVLADYGAFVRHAREVWAYENIVLVGWSGGGSLTTFYQSQAECPNIVETPAGDPIELPGLMMGDALIFHSAHLSRAECLQDCIDPSVRDEANPDVRDVELDLYDPRNPNQPPYSPDYIEYFRAEQRARMRRRTTYVKELLTHYREGGRGSYDHCIVTHRTFADPRFLDGALDANDRVIGTSFMGDPQTANEDPAGIARFSTLRAWLSQWSVDDTRAHAEKVAPNITVPVLAIENGADNAVPQPHTRRFFDAAGATDKSMHLIENADHYYADQAELMAEAVDLQLEWLEKRGFIG